MDETQALPPAPPRRRNWLLIASLCLNIALIPILVVVVLGAMKGGAQLGAGGGALAPRALIAEFPDREAAIQKAIDARGAKIRELRKAATHARRVAFDLLASPDFTPQKLSAALDAVRAADAALEDQVVALLGESLTTLTPDQRAAVVEKVRKRNRSWLFRLFRPRGR